MRDEKPDNSGAPLRETLTQFMNSPRPLKASGFRRFVTADISPAIPTLGALLLSSSFTFAHLIGDPAHDGGRSQYDFKVSPPGIIIIAQADLEPRSRSLGAPNRTTNAAAARIAAAFARFAPKVQTHADEKFFFVESDGLPAHNLMVGITAWQQQVPLPQSYFGDNAWRFPLTPVPAAQPRTIKNQFLRGAIAIAANGIPIFNPQNNRGEISAEIGELDQWGGHCGRADDYHYHAAPLHLQSLLGPGLPIAYALDGYAIYGLTEPEGTTPQDLDPFNGHATTALGYHYHASTKYPYVNGGFHGEVTEAQEQVDPQPLAQPVRPAQPPLRGAKIIGFTRSADLNGFALHYSLDGRSCGVNYTNLGTGRWKFQFLNADAMTKEETYSTLQRRPGAGGPRRERDNAPREDRPRPDGDHRSPAQGSPPPTPRESASAPPPLILTPPHSGKLKLTSSVVRAGDPLPDEFNGDGPGISPPLEWHGAPAGTKSFAIVMDHLAPGNEMKSYWVIWDIPATTTRLAKNAHDPGTLGRSFRGKPGYEPPHSRGPGLKTYTIHLYALSAAPQMSQPPGEITRERLLMAIQDSILDSAELKVTYTRPEQAPAK